MVTSLVEQNIIFTPRHVDIEITSRCNLRCRYCYYFNDDGHPLAELPTTTWLNFFKELSDLKVMDVTLTGGEPFIREDLPQLLDEITANRMRFNILSNGTLISSEIASHIAHTGRCDGVQISIDGPSSDIHDEFRGSGSFDKAVRGIRLLQQNDIRVDVRFTVHHQNVSMIRETADFLLNTLNLQRFTVNSAGYFGSCTWQGIELTTADRTEAMRTLLEVSAQYPGRISATAGPLAEASMWRRMMDDYNSNAPKTGGTLSACGCMFQKIAVLSDGTIVPCNLLTSVRLGNIQNDSLESVWRHSEELTKLRQRHHIALSTFEMCRDCPYQDYCTGNCPGLASSITGQVNHPAPDACLKRFLESGGLVP